MVDSTVAERVGMRSSLGTFVRATRSLPGDAQGCIPVFEQILETSRHVLAFERGSAAYQVLSNDQKRYAPPRSLPPIVDLVPPDDPDAPSASYTIVRHAYTEGAYALLCDLLARGHVFGMRDFLDFAWSLAEALAYLHAHGIVHGQWNDRSIVAIPVEQRAACPGAPTQRFEVLNSGVCFRRPEQVPREWVERGYYPPESFVADGSAPDYGALDLEADVYGFAAFLIDLMKRACSAEELPSQATRILAELQREASRRGRKAAPDALRQKELEVLDHLYTIKVRTEALMQEGTQPRGERASAAHLLALLRDLHERASRYFETLFDAGFAAVDVFGEDLQHYTAFQLELEPGSVSRFTGGRVVLTGSGLPQEFVRVTVAERHDGIRVERASASRIEIEVAPGLPTGRHRLSINNRRTNAALEVYAPEWHALEPPRVHRPWDGFGNVRVELRGQRLPVAADWALRAHDEEPVAAIVVETADGVFEAPRAPGTTQPEADLLTLTFPCDTPAARYELFANGLPTGLSLELLEQLPQPVVGEAALERGRISNHRDQELRLCGRNFHEAMVVALRAEAASVEPPAVGLRVDGPTEATLRVPRGFPPGTHRLLVNHAPTAATLEVVEPAWTGCAPDVVQLARAQREPVAIELRGSALPPIGDGSDEEGYRLLDPRGRTIAGGVVDAAIVEPETAHRLRLAPGLRRGAHRLAFAGLDTGLRLQVARPRPRTVGVALEAAAVLLVALGALWLRRELAPRIESFAPAVVWAFGEPRLELRGEQLARVGLVTEDDETAAELPLTPDAERPGLFVASLADVAAGRYRLRPIGTWFAETPGSEPIDVRPPGLSLRPLRIHRLEPATLVLESTTGFDVRRSSSLQLRGPAGTVDLGLADGRASCAAGTFSASMEGEYRVAIDGVPLELRLSVVGPQVEGLSPNPATLDADGVLAVRLAASHLPADGWIGLVAAEAAGSEPGAPAQLVAGEDGRHRTRVEPGEYALVVGREAGAPEPVPDLVLRVLPSPMIASIAPTRLRPDQESRVTVEGRNLGALDALVLRSLEGEREPVAVPIDAARVVATEGLTGNFDFAIALPAGRYRVEPAALELTLEVFDDGVAAVEAFRQGGHAKGLLDALAAGRPSQRTWLAAADLLFDRGLLVEAAAIYREHATDIAGRVRANFVGAFVEDRPIPLLLFEEDELDDPYATVAVKLGWANGGDPEWPADLPWELLFARATKEPDAARRLAMLEASVEMKRRASDGHELAAFEPALDLLAATRLPLAVDALRSTEVDRAGALLGALIGGDDFARLSSAAQAEALFWQGHLALWYAGDRVAALEAFEQARAIGSGAAAGWSRVFASALGAEVDASAELSRHGGSWEHSFACVHRILREITDEPNYDLLTTREDGGFGLSPEDREKSAALHAHLRDMESLTPTDPFVHHALVHHVRSAQQLAWPDQVDARRTEEARARLLGVTVDPSLEPLKQFYLLQGEVAPFFSQQIAVLSRAERLRYADRAEAVSATSLPEPFRALALELRDKLLGPSVVWWRESWRNR